MTQRRIIADSSALILLAKCGLLEVVCDLFKVIVPLSVIKEVASDELVRIYPDAAFISKLVSNNAMRVRSSVKKKQTLPITMHQGEEDAIMLAAVTKDALFASDDGKAIKAAKFLNVPFAISPKLVVALYKLQKIYFRKARDSLEKLGKIGRYSPEIIADALTRLVEEKYGEANDNQDT
jgi:predicted nucleic acid-binding protein